MFDFLDEMGAYAPPAGGGLPARPRIPPLSPQEEDSILGRITGSALGGLGYVGSVLEKTFGGRALRGVLAGKPRELLSPIPFSDTLGITDEQDRVSGKELLGLGEDSGWGGTLAGIGAELALDPAMYLSFGGAALTKAGQIGKLARPLPNSIAGRATTTLGEHLGIPNVGPPTLAQSVASDLAKARGVGLDEPLGGVLGIGLPFSKPAVVLGAGQGGADFMAGLGKFGSAVDAGLRKVPLVGGMYGLGADAVSKVADVGGRYARSLLDPEVMEATTASGQVTAPLAREASRQFLSTQKDRLAGYYQRLKAAGAEPTGDELRSLVEGVYKGPPVHPEVAAVADAIKADLADARGRITQLGGNVEALQDIYAGYLPRYRTLPGGRGSPRQPLVASDPRLAGREDIFKNIQGGTSGPGGLNQLFGDPAVYQGTPKQAAAHVAANYLHPNAPAAHALGLVDYARNSLPADFAQAAQARKPLRVFDNHPLADLETYYERAARLLGAAEASHKLFSRTAVDARAALPAGHVRYEDALKQAGLSLPTGNLDTAMSLVNAERQAQGLPPLARLQVAKEMAVPEEAVKEVTRYLRPFQTPEAISEIGGAADWLTNLFKAWQTAPWPAFHVRNAISGAWQNAMKGLFDTPGGGTASYAAMKDLLAGQTMADAHLIPEYAKLGLTPAQATEKMAGELYARGLGPHAGNLAAEVLGPSGGVVGRKTDLADFGRRIPGVEPLTLGGAAQKYVGAAPGQEVNWLRPDLIQGVGATTDLHPLVAGGREAGNLVEALNRGALYYGLRRQGYTADEAARQVFEAHFNYTAAGKTETERRLLARLVPFYTYARGNIPFQLEQLATRPGGAAGTLARVAQDLRQEGGFLPDYLGSGLAIPAGEEEGGTRRYLTRLDLPPEQAFEVLHGGPRWAQNSVMSLLSQANPAVKGPLEFATGKQFFTGRDTGDLYSATGSSTLDQLLANSPASRVATTARTLLDERKWSDPLAALSIPLNLGTGARVSDVDMAKQRTIAEREFLTEALRGMPDVSRFETFYPRVPVGELSPEELTLLRLQRTIEQKARQAAQKKIRVQ
jgi:hypothetical protein